MYKRQQITWAKELKQAYEQFQVLGESRDILTKSLDLYRQVNGVIKDVYKRQVTEYWPNVTLFGWINITSSSVGGI